MAEKKAVRKTIDIQADDYKKLSYQAVDAGLKIKKYLEKVLGEKAKK